MSSYVHLLAEMMIVSPLVLVKLQLSTKFEKKSQFEFHKEEIVVVNNTFYLQCSVRQFAENNLVFFGTSTCFLSWVGDYSHLISFMIEGKAFLCFCYTTVCDCTFI